MTEILHSFFNRKTFWLIVMNLMFTISWCQTNTSNCIEKFEVSANRVPNDNSPIDSIKLTWDNSEKSLNVSFEIQPLDACWLGLDGKKRSEIIRLKTTYSTESTKHDLELKFKDLNAKCFKWRTILIDTTTGCQTETQWQFASFL